MKVWYVLLCLFSPYYLLAQSNLGPRLTAIPDKWALQARPPVVSLNLIERFFSNNIGKHAIVKRMLFKHFFSGAAIPLYGCLNYTPQTTTTYAL